MQWHSNNYNKDMVILLIFSYARHKWKCYRVNLMQGLWWSSGHPSRHRSYCLGTPVAASLAIQKLKYLSSNFLQIINYPPRVIWRWKCILQDRTIEIIFAWVTASLADGFKEPCSLNIEFKIDFLRSVFLAPCCFLCSISLLAHKVVQLNRGNVWLQWVKQFQFSS
jgi:hypothetical protein